MKQKFEISVGSNDYSINGSETIGFYQKIECLLFNPGHIQKSVISYKFKINVKGKNYRYYRVKYRISLQSQTTEDFLSSNKTGKP